MLKPNFEEADGLGIGFKESTSLYCKWLSNFEFLFEFFKIQTFVESLSQSFS